MTTYYHTLYQRPIKLKNWKVAKNDMKMNDYKNDWDELTFRPKDIRPSVDLGQYVYRLRCKRMEN